MCIQTNLFADARNDILKRYVSSFVVCTMEKTCNLNKCFPRPGRSVIDLTGTPDSVLYYLSEKAVTLMNCLSWILSFLLTVQFSPLSKQLWKNALASKSAWWIDTAFRHADAKLSIHFDSDGHISRSSLFCFTFPLLLLKAMDRAHQGYLSKSMCWNGQVQRWQPGNRTVLVPYQMLGGSKFQQ